VTLFKSFCVQDGKLGEVKISFEFLIGECAGFLNFVELNILFVIER